MGTLAEPLQISNQLPAHDAGFKHIRTLMRRALHEALIKSRFNHALSLKLDHLIMQEELREDSAGRGWPW